MAMSDLELARGHLITARAALRRHYDEGRYDLHVQGLERLVSDLEETVRREAAEILTFNGVEYADIAGRA